MALAAEFELGATSGRRWITRDVDPMSLYEFILVMVSLVLAIGVTHLLHEMASIVRYRETLEIDLVTVLWTVILFFSAILYWWSLWDFIAVEWTFPRFCFLLLTPILLFGAISLLVSEDVSSPGTSLAASFERVRVPFMASMALVTLGAGWDGWVFGVEPFWNSLRLVQAVMAGLYLVAAASPRRVIQTWVPVGVLAMLLFNAFGLRYLPGAFGS